ncbi:MAG TPA: RtcB family protein [Candidatus Goldiibacteriota bacterium]|nr:RtcB family protein [Candidatus Goldiibacteriota bacterium]
MLKKISDFKYSIEKSGDMLVPGIIYGKDKTIADAGDETIAQVEAAACLPGIESCSIAMPDMHLGYGFPIGGVAAFDIKAGVIAPGAVGYDINCGVRLISTGVLFEEARGRLEALADALYNAVPTGIGAEGDIDLRHKDFLGVIKRGAAWAVESGFGSEDDISRTEDLGVMRFDGDDSVISTDAFERGKRQLGTLGSGNHFLEVQELTEIFDTAAADAYGLFKGQLCVMFHSGSRGFGYRVCAHLASSLG